MLTITFQEYFHVFAFMSVRVRVPALPAKAFRNAIRYSSIGWI
jgi:hypothetical protein